MTWKEKEAELFESLARRCGALEEVGIDKKMASEAYEVFDRTRRTRQHPLLKLTPREQELALFILTNWNEFYEYRRCLHLVLDAEQALKDHFDSTKEIIATWN